LRGETARQSQQRIEAGVVAPVQILDDYEQRPTRCPVAEELHERLGEPAPLLLRIEGRQGRKIGEQHLVLGHQADELRSHWAECRRDRFRR
jgi:hypothetical protein